MNDFGIEEMKNELSADEEEAAAMGHDLKELEESDVDTVWGELKGENDPWALENQRLTAEGFMTLMTNPKNLAKVRKIVFGSAEKGLAFDVHITMELQTGGKTPAYYTHKMYIKEIVDRIHTRMLEELQR